MNNPLLFDIKGHRMAARAYNTTLTGTPLIFLHGVTGSIDFWEANQTPSISERLRWYSLSLPGHYPAQFPADYSPAQFTVDELAEVLLGAINQLVGDTTPFIVVGYSTGGFAALLLASRYPERVAGVVSVAGFYHGRWTGGLGIWQNWARSRFMRRAFMFHHDLMPKTAAMFKQGAHTLMYKPKLAHKNTPDLAHKIEMTRPDRRHLPARASLAYFQRMPDMTIEAEVAKIRAPLLLLAGEHDPIVPNTQSQKLAQLVPASQLVLLAECGHVPMWETPAAYHEAITQWLTQMGTL